MYQGIQQDDIGFSTLRKTFINRCYLFKSRNYGFIEMYLQNNLKFETLCDLINMIKTERKLELTYNVYYWR